VSGKQKLNYYEFFAGGGMARAGLGPNWRCLFANDIDQKKAGTYIRNWGADVFRMADIAGLSTETIVAPAELAWASFPCQDLSLAGNGAGLNGDRSGTFWPFWRLMKAMSAEGRAVPLIALENVCGALTSHSGKDFAAIASAITAANYRFGALVIDAIHFVPQSRPRLFIIAVHKSVPFPSKCIAATPTVQWHTAAIIAAHKRLNVDEQSQWLWWNLPEAPKRTSILADYIVDDPCGVSWHTAQETQRLLALMSPINREKVKAAMQAQRRMVGTVYKRTRYDENGSRVQRAEIRFDGIAGCLRTPVGGSSRQTIMIVEGKCIRSRLLSPREAARLMGLTDGYQLPENYNEAYHLAGDGVAVPVVRFLAKNLLEPIALAAKLGEKEAA
jgi:DNA (cytosine-5)-methyltransferase 1